MVTATNSEVEEIVIPDELAENNNAPWPGVIVSAELALPDERKQMAVRAGGGVVRPEIKIAIKHLDFEYLPDPRFDDTLVHNSVPVFDKNGNFQSKGSQLDDYTQAYAACGFKINTNAQLAQLVGKKFLFKSGYKRLNAADYKDPWQDLPVAPCEDYVSPTPLHKKSRPGATVPAVNNSLAALSNHRGVDEAAATEILKRVLNGKTETEYVTAIINSAGFVGEGQARKIMCEPFLGEAGQREPMTTRMINAGMTIVDGRLVGS